MSSDIITGVYMPTKWRQGRYTVTRHQGKAGRGFFFTIKDHKTTRDIEFNADCGYLCSYHSEEDIFLKWHSQAVLKNRTRRLPA